MSESFLQRSRLRRRVAQREQLQALVAEHGGNLAEVARALGMSRAGVHYRCKSLGLMNGVGDERRECVVTEQRQ